ncbi:MAG: hypothetical protein H8D23_01390 [Candidatus Brocadiales bacterium]|nr:hypothetical protein [Candidatus Brocadiales bacterium]
MPKGYMPKSKNQEHLTPDRVFELIQEKWDLRKEQFNDPCPAGTPYKAPCFFNGLYGKWDRWNFVNPPFEVKTLRKFYEKAKEQMMIMNQSIMLLPAKTDQDWFHDIIKRQYEIKWIEGRLKFKGAKDGSMGGHFLVKLGI